MMRDNVVRQLKAFKQLLEWGARLEFKVQGVVEAEVSIRRPRLELEGALHTAGCRAKA